jgi:hypothetical protein
MQQHLAYRDEFHPEKRLVGLFDSIVQVVHFVNCQLSSLSLFISICVSGVATCSGTAWCRNR